MSEPLALTAHSGRIKICLQAEWLGPDLLVRLSGGAGHIGAVALAAPGKDAEAISAPGHLESELARAIADLLQDRLNRGIAVVAGIHYDSITKSEIDAVYDLSFSLVAQFFRIQEGFANVDNEGSGRI